MTPPNCSSSPLCQNHFRHRFWNISVIRFCVSGFLALFSSSFFVSCGEKEATQVPPLDVQVINVLEEDVELESVFTGQTFGESDIEIAPRVTGLVESVNFREGTQVTQGQLLYTIDHLPYQNKVEVAKGTLAEAQTLLAKAKADLDMIEPLAKINAVSQRELVLAKTQHEAAKGRLQSAEASLKNAEIELGYCNVEAPISGLIGISKVRVGDYVTPGPTAGLNTISQLGDVRVRFTITEEEFMRVMSELRSDSSAALKKQRTKVRLILANGEVYRLPGKINFSDRQIDPTTGAITIEALFENPDNILRPGQYAKVAVVTHIRRNALLIPQRSVNEMQGMFQVFTVGDSNKVVVKVIKPGTIYKDAYVVDEGLKFGEKVILGGTRMLKPGAPVHPQPLVWKPGISKAEGSQN